MAQGIEGVRQAHLRYIRMALGLSHVQPMFTGGQITGAAYMNDVLALPVDDTDELITYQDWETGEEIAIVDEGVDGTPLQ